MPAPQLLPGEHEELRLRPAPAGFLPAYAAALLPAVAGLLLWGLARMPAWENSQRSEPPWQVWNHLWGDDQALAFYAVCLIVLAALADFAVRRRARSFVLATCALLLLMAGSVVLAGNPTGTALPLLLMALSVPALGWVEARRRNTLYVFTNLRLIVRRSMPRHRETAVRHQDLVDLQGHPSVADVGTLVPVLGKDAAAAAPPGPTLRFPGVRPFDRVRAFAELLVQRATAGDYLRADGRLDQRIAEARAALQRQG